MTDPSYDAWTLEVYEPNAGPAPFAQFSDSLDDFQFAALDAALRTVLEKRGLGLASSEWLKPLGQGLHEFRIRHTADEIQHMFGDSPALAALPSGGAVLLRVFVHFHGQRVILLVSGYDKRRNPKPRFQQVQIEAARKHLATWRRQEAKRRRSAK